MTFAWVFRRILGFVLLIGHAFYINHVFKSETPAAPVVRGYSYQTVLKAERVWASAAAV